MKIAVVGTGYVGLVTGVCMAEFGFDVVCIDKDESKIAALKQNQVPIYEKNLPELLEKNAAAGRISFATEISTDVLSGVDVIFIAVGTPPRRSARDADLSYVETAAKQVVNSISDYAVIVTKSTVPIGTSGRLKKIMREENESADFDVASNPEFLREGSAVEDFMNPDRIIIGTETERARGVMEALYKPLYAQNAKIFFTDIATSETIKYASNSFLATKVAFMNDLARMCELTGADVTQVADGMGLDDRIGRAFLNAGPGYGGSCFPKDTNAICETATQLGMELGIIEAVIKANETHKAKMAEKILTALDGGKRVGFLGLTFKPGTDDMRDSATIDIINNLLENGVSVQAYDPKGMDEARKIFGDKIEYCQSAELAMEGAEALVIATEWNEFRSLQASHIKEKLVKPVVVDLRNIFDGDTMKAAGIEYYSVGRGF